MYSKHLIVIFLLFTSFSFAQTKILRASLSTAPQTARVGDFTVQQSIGHMGIIGTVNHQQHTILTGFLLPQSAATSAVQNIDIDLQVYPNPFVDHLNLSFNTSVTGDVVVHLHDVTGQLIDTKVSKAKQEQRIDLGHLAKAQYLLTVEVMGKHFTYKLIKTEH